MRDSLTDRETAWHSERQKDTAIDARVYGRHRKRQRKTVRYNDRPKRNENGEIRRGAARFHARWADGQADAPDEARQHEGEWKERMGMQTHVTTQHQATCVFKSIAPDTI